MQIDRARFLFLTASLAGGAGCSATPVQPGPGPGPGPAPTGTQVGVTETPQTATETESLTTAAQTTVASAEPTTTSAPVQPPGACDNDTGTVPSCSIAAPPGPFCESLSDTKAACKSYKSSFRGAIAAKAVACLNAASKTPAICDYQKAETCGTEAIRTACVQPSTFNACSPIVSTCAGSSWSKITMQDCQQLLSAVKDGKRQQMITCMTEGCSIESCTWMLR